MDDETGESPDFKKCKTTNCTRLMGLSSFVVIGNNILVLIFSKLHSQSYYYLYLKSFTSCKM